MTQEQVAEAVGIERKTYSTYETNRSEPKLELLKKIIRFVDMGPEFYTFFMEQNVPEKVNSDVLEPAPESSLLELVKAQRVLKIALDKIEKRIFDISEGKGTHAAHQEKKGTLS